MHCFDANYHQTIVQFYPYRRKVVFLKIPIFDGRKKQPVEAPNPSPWKSLWGPVPENSEYTLVPYNAKTIDSSYLGHLFPNFWKKIFEKINQLRKKNQLRSQLVFFSQLVLFFGNFGELHFSIDPGEYRPWIWGFGGPFSAVLWSFTHFPRVSKNDPEKKTSWKKNQF